MPIFDQGYQHWSGQLSGHAWRWLAITRHGVRVGMRNRFVRYILFASWVPALALVVMLSLWGLLERGSSLTTTFMQYLSAMEPALTADPRGYRVDIWRLSYSYFLHIELYSSMFMVLLIGPGLISQDLRFNTLPLYFSRPIRRIDYFVGKLGVIVVFLALVMIVPSVVGYIAGLFFSLDITIIRDTFAILLGAVAFGLLVSISAGALVLALSCLSRNSRYVALLWLGLWFVSGVVGTVLQAVDQQQRRWEYFHAETALASPPEMEPGQTPQQRRAAFEDWRRARRQANEEFRVAEMGVSATDWRPLVSYDSNLARMEQVLLGTDKTWQRLSQLAPDEFGRQRFLADHEGPQYPWYWSAGVLAGLLVISAGILKFSIKSLDRLK